MTPGGHGSRMRFPALVLLLLALPGVLASPAGTDARGDQTTFLGTAGSNLLGTEPSTPCAAPATDILAVHAGTAEGVVTLAVVVADLADARIACADAALDAVPRFIVEFVGADFYGLAWSTATTQGARLDCPEFPCPGLPATVAADGNALTWRFPVAGDGWDLAGADVTVTVRTASYAHHDPWETTRPTLRVSDAAGPFPATL